MHRSIPFAWWGKPVLTLDCFAAVIHSIKGITAAFDMDTIIISPFGINLKLMYNSVSLVKFFTVL